MTRMCQSVDLLVLSCLFLTVESQQGHILPPQNVSLTWISDFDPQLSWAPPPHSVENCQYKVKVNTKRKDDFIESVPGPSWHTHFVMEGGFLEMSVQTVCGNNHPSELVTVSVDYPVLVRDWECYMYSATHTHCSWPTASQAQDLRFFYWLLHMDSVDGNYEPSSLRLQECSLYKGDVRTGCDLEMNVHHSIYVLFNGTLNNTFARNTFNRWPIKVRPPPLNWTVTKTTDRFLIEWTPPDIPLSWTYIIKYTECGKPKIKTDIKGNSYELNLRPECQYYMTIKGSTNEGGTPESDEKYFDADTGPNAWLYAAIIIPLMLAGLTALMIVCCRKNKEYIFPKVPEPRNLLSDISNNNNNKSTVHSLYVLPEEEDNCKITLVVDALINRLDF
ncbi:interleukin-13 receptor subunit alpha-1 isoform X2 [Cebidichthys violaceus]|uniref:interleukin-13 receptor subunit alpha-1 isoform X2 n=1 Tax=Cebidichthys violaceus TaxID=271503 RepID=UPI0035CCA3B7